MPGGKTKVEIAWEQLFAKHDILARVKIEGDFRTTSALINELHEARLMAKFDQSSQLPVIFRTNRLSILPTTRGNYVIGPFVAHEHVIYRENVKPKQIVAPPLETLNAKDLYSEAAALLFAYNSGIISDVMGSDSVKFTVSGRMKSGVFSYFINNNLRPQDPAVIEVNNSQIEIDAGFESPDAFLLCEVKNQASQELLIRQLYYPYRKWKEKLTKPIIPVFIAFTNDVFHVFVYEFSDMESYNSLTLKDYREYTFADEDISLHDIITLWRSTSIITEPNVPFPQADSFPRVLDLLSVLHEEDLTRSEVTLIYEFDPRQTNYYVSACEYLGLINRFTNDENEQCYRLTEEARNIMSLPYKAKYLALMRRVLDRSVFNKAFEVFVNSNELPDKRIICQIMKDTDFRRPINDTTIDRRASTVLGWLKWMINITRKS